MSSSSKLAALPSGFKASGVSAKIKKSGKKDLALLYSSAPCVASAMFTSNRVKAAPVIFCEKVIKSGGQVRAIIANSGNANCMTGNKGIKDAEITAQLVARNFGIASSEVMVSSTGIIGRLLPVEKIESAMPGLVENLSADKFNEAAEAILTTDTFAKVVVKKMKIAHKTITISGMAKGAGMIAPNMKACLPAGRHATMLAYILTDACISRAGLDEAVSRSVEPSFNSITIDGCMSTNDTVIVLANGESGARSLARPSENFNKFCCALKEVCMELAKMIVLDAEGATKFIEVLVRGAKNPDEAKALAFSVANSNLFKCAMFGSDPNWGRIAAALGSVSSCLKWEKMGISLNNRFVFKSGKPVVLKDSGLLKAKNITVCVDLNQGRSQARVYTSDLSYDYVKINADYN